MTLTHKEIFERYMYAGAISRNPVAVAAMFTEDGVYEAPLIPDGHRLPRRLTGPRCDPGRPERISPGADVAGHGECRAVPARAA